MDVQSKQVSVKHVYYTHAIMGAPDLFAIIIYMSRMHGVPRVEKCKPRPLRPKSL